MRAGALRNQVQFVKYKQEPDGAGGTTPEKEVVYSTRASVKALKQVRTLQANQTTLKAAYELTIRWRPDIVIVQEWDVLLKDKPHSITSIVLNEQAPKEWAINIVSQ